LGDLLESNKENLPQFLEADERGRAIPGFVQRLGSRLRLEQEKLMEMVRALNDNVDHINEIVATQQAYAKVTGVLETVSAAEVVEDAMRMHGEGLKRHGIQLEARFSTTPAITMDRHKVLQILFNLLENAKRACIQAGGLDRKVTVSTQRRKNGFVRIVVADNGVGIPPENLPRIFDQGFSTRRDGHGFGLHSSILAAQDMGGGLSVESGGMGQGASFALDLPETIKQPEDHGAKRRSSNGVNA
jgi:signal transduction histidine kinase